MVTIVYYSCFKCGLDRVPCSVKAREQENVIEWMKILGEKLSADHSERSPDCHPKQLNNIMIPIDNRSKVGGPVEN